MPLESRERYWRFMRAWAETHGISVAQARRSRLARTYYAMSYGAPRWMIARAWEEAGVLERYEDENGRERWRYTEEAA